MINPNILAIIAAVLYFCAAVLLLLSLSRADDERTFGQHTAAGRRALMLAAVAVLIHALVALKQTGLPTKLHLSFFVSMNVASLFIAWWLLVLCVRRPADYLGLAVYPVAGILLLISSAVDSPSSDLPLNIELHVLLSLTAYAFLSLAAAQAVLVWVQRKKLHNHRPGGYLRVLPALDETERLLFTLLTIGFAVLTLSLGTGFFYLEGLFEQSLVHKTVLSVIAWFIFGGLLFARWRFGWRGQRAVFWTFIGFGMLILAYFGTKFVLEIVLHRG